MADDIDLDKLVLSGTYRLTAATNPFDRLLLDKLTLSAGVKLAVQPDNPFDNLHLEKLGAAAAFRGPAVGFGSAPAAGRAMAQSEVVLAIRPAADDAVGGWKNEADGTTLYSSIGKPADDDATYVRAEQGVAGDTARVKLSLPVYELGDEVHVDYRIGKYPPLATQPLDITVRLLQGAVPVASWTHTDVSGTPESVTRTLTAEGIAAITDFGDLFLEFVSTPY
jgi:hypothetical protein